jgi:hypothetical protein
LFFRAARLTATAVCLIGAASAGVCIGLYRADGQRLQQIALWAAGPESSLSERVARLTRWVFHNQGFSENHRFFVWPRLRATPVQVLETGGDCADKSRLLAAMLRRIGIPATMVMCFDPRTRQPVHTVVEAAIGPGEYMVADPVYDLVFPRPTGGYFGLSDLRRDPEILQHRVAELIRERPRNAPIRSYRREVSVYGLASTFNWNKNILTRVALAVIQPFYGDGVYRLPRPAVLEEPQLALATLLSLVAVGAACIAHQLERRCAHDGAATAGARRADSIGAIIDHKANQHALGSA